MVWRWHQVTLDPALPHNRAVEWVLHDADDKKYFGKESAMAAGLTVAAGDAVILMDADLQHPPAVIPTLLTRWREGADIVNATKDHRGREFFLYKLAAQVFYRLMGSALGEGFNKLSQPKRTDGIVTTAGIRNI